MMRWISLGALLAWTASCGSDDTAARQAGEGDASSADASTAGEGAAGGNGAAGGSAVGGSGAAGGSAVGGSGAAGTRADAAAAAGGASGAASDGGPVAGSGGALTDAARSDAATVAPDGGPTDASVASDVARLPGDATAVDGSDGASTSTADAGAFPDGSMPEAGCACAATELCAEGGSCRARNESCATAIDASGGGTFTGSLCNAGDDDSFSCSSAGLADVYFHFAPGDYLISMPTGVSAAFTNECPRTSAPSLCLSPFPSSLTQYTLSADKWLAIEPRGACGEYTLTVIAL